MFNRCASFAERLEVDSSEPSASSNEIARSIASSNAKAACRASSATAPPPPPRVRGITADEMQRLGRCASFAQRLDVDTDTMDRLEHAQSSASQCHQQHQAKTWKQASNYRRCMSFADRMEVDNVESHCQGSQDVSGGPVEQKKRLWSQLDCEGCDGDTDSDSGKEEAKDTSAGRAKQSGKDGPATLEELFQWPERFMDSVSSLSVRSLSHVLAEGVAVRSQYSGLGAAELALRLLDAAAVSRGSNASAEHKGVRVVSQVDKSDVCIRLLCESSAPDTHMSSRMSWIQFPAKFDDGWQHLRRR